MTLRIKQYIKEKKKPKHWYTSYGFITTCLLIIGLMIFNINYAIIVVNGQSMEPTYSNGSILIAEKHVDQITRFSPVVVYSDIAHKILIKRIIGLPGETVEYKNNILYIDGNQIKDIYNFGNTNDFKISLQKDEYCCLGDNRSNSADSRVYGAILQPYIIGKVK